MLIGCAAVILTDVQPLADCVFDPIDIYKHRGFGNVT